MKTSVWILMAFFVVGCGGPTVVTSDGEKISTDARGNATVENKDGRTEMRDGKVTFEGKDGQKLEMSDKGMKGTDGKGGTYDFSKTAVQESDLGIPFYPGSESQDTYGSGKMETAESQSYITMRKTKDTPDKIVEFYKPHVVDASQTTANDMAMIAGKLKTGEDVSIYASKDSDGQTTFQITVKRTKKKP